MSSATLNTTYAALPTTERGKPIIMAGSPDGTKFAYCRGNYLIVRDVANPEKSFTFNEHAHPVTTVRWAPSGFYVASGDAKGNVKIWDTTQDDHKVKYEYQVLSGAIKDIAWTEDSKRLGVCGEGSELYARAILWDSGSNCGTLTGHTKSCNSIDIKPNRPYRLVTASEDTDIGFYAGPPFKREQWLSSDHSKFVNCVRYSPDGSMFVTCDAGGKCFVYDGKDGSKKCQLGGDAGAHKGGVYGVSWNKDSKRLITASADKTVKLWDVEANTATTFTIGSDLNDQQVGCLWVGDTIMSTSLSGFINILDEADPSKPKKILKGHAKNITALAVSDSGAFYAGSSEGRLSSWETSGMNQVYTNGHTNQIQDVVVSGNKVISVGMDDSLRVSNVGDASLGEPLKLSSQPHSLSAANDMICVGSLNHVTFATMDGKKMFEHECSGSSSSAISPDGKEVAIGCAKNIFIFSVSGSALTEKKVIDSASGATTCLAFSPCGKFLATGNDKRQVFVYSTDNYDLTKDRWKFHTSRITHLAWSADSKYVVSGSLDTNVIVWYMDSMMKKLIIKEATPRACVSKVQWTSADQIIVGGYDGCIRTYDLKL